MTTLKAHFERSFRDPKLLERAFTHRSFHNENQAASCGHNERLEFLGDAVLDLALSDFLMADFPELSEGDLSKLRASLVNEEALAELAGENGLDKMLRLGKGETLTGGSRKPRLLASVLEAYIGALYLDAGFEETRKFLRDLFSIRLTGLDTQTHFERDFKTRLQEMAQEQYRQAPQYEVTSESGPDHDKKFSVTVKVNGLELARGEGRNKKQAEQEAAKAAIKGWE
jgi:ribonuclease III